MYTFLIFDFWKIIKYGPTLCLVVEKLIFLKISSFFSDWLSVCYELSRNYLDITIQEKS